MAPNGKPEYELGRSSNDSGCNYGRASRAMFIATLTLFVVILALGTTFYTSAWQRADAAIRELSIDTRQNSERLSETRETMVRMEERLSIVADDIVDIKQSLKEKAP